VLKKNINLKFTNPKDGRKIYDERIRQIFNVQAYTFWRKYVISDNLKVAKLLGSGGSHL
jgi:hypothetical protein